MSAEELFIRKAVVFGSALVYWGGVLIQARRVRKHIGRSPNLKPRGLKEQLLWLGWFLVIMMWMGQPFVAGEKAFGPLLRLEPSLLNLGTLVAGLALVVGGYAGTHWCYVAMGDQWRIGINRKEKNPLVTRGPYRRMRHPIYSFQVVMLVGTVLLLPTILSLAVLLVHVACVSIKATDEETYLLGVHGQVYREYLDHTGRLLPKL